MSNLTLNIIVAGLLKDLLVTFILLFGKCACYPCLKSKTK